MAKTNKTSTTKSKSIKSKNAKSTKKSTTKKATAKKSSTSKKAISKKAEESKKAEIAAINKKKNSSAFVASLLFILAVAAGWMLTFQNQSSHEAIFADNLEHSLQKTSATLEYLTPVSSGAATSNAYNVDYSDIGNIVLSGMANLSSPAAEVDIQNKLIYDGEHVYLNFSKYHYQGEPLLARKALNTWVQFDPELPLEALGADFNQVGAMNSIATPIGQVPDGNFSDEQQKELFDMMTIGEGEAYFINSSEERSEDGVDYVVYDVSLNGEKITALNAKVVEFANSEKVTAGSFSDQRFTVWVNKDTRQFFRAETEGSILIMTDYGEAVDVQAPEDFISAQEFVEAMDFETLQTIQFEAVEGDQSA